tara:strand:- start:397 stop:594 length:198 start_codon:yes stop_codon:yes gene_type:complete
LEFELSSEGGGVSGLKYEISSGGGDGGVEMGVEVQPNLSELFYTTTVCVHLAFLALQYHRKNTYI